MGRKLLWASLGLAPIAIAVRYATDAGDVALFVLSAAALIPLAWLIGEATEHAGEHTGPGIGGFLNASFGNAPELIIALFAVSDGLPEVVRGSLIGSVVSNLLLVLGLAVMAAPDARRGIDRLSMLTQLGLVSPPRCSFSCPRCRAGTATPSGTRSRWRPCPSRSCCSSSTGASRRGAFAATGDSTGRAARRPATPGPCPLRSSPSAGRPSSPRLSARSSSTPWRRSPTTSHLSEFFVAIVIVAIVGNAAEHGGAIVLARRGGNLRLATEIAVSSSAQVAVLVTPAVALLSWAVLPALPLSFRPIELAALGGAVLVVALSLRDGRAPRWEGTMLVGVLRGCGHRVLLRGRPLGRRSRARA